MGYTHSQIGTIIEFSNSLKDTIWAKKIYQSLKSLKDSERYLGTEKQFLQAIRNANSKLLIPIDHSEKALHKLDTTLIDEDIDTLVKK